MTEEMTQLDRYLRGLPLSDENAALMEGREPAAEIFYSEQQAKPSATDDEDDRMWLRRLVAEPGYAVLLKLVNRAIQRREDSARLLSSVDPFGNKEQIVNEWAYIACYKAVLVEIQRAVESALE